MCLFISAIVRLNLMFAIQYLIYDKTFNGVFVSPPLTRITLVLGARYQHHRSELRQSCVVLNPRRLNLQLSHG